ncbi:hypothetical protein RND71_042021 [Anisodus tanguticus]|uniref:Uncharacterized protein n=1 Tax=Anisodus tanguticus TaxID=243964 RepID=A0AAE1QQT7_9SOLA|nr:hypothetical protein RND71_042021 [Anisodus tanguticus]
MKNATVEVHNNATDLIDASNVKLGQQNRGVTTEKTALAVAARVEKSGQHDNIGDQVIDVVASQQLDCISPDRKEQAANCEDKVSRKLVCSNTFDALMINSDQELNAATPTLHISNPEITSIVKEPQAAMLIKENPMIKQPMCRINTSDHDVHSQSLESLGEKMGDSGQQLISTENDKDFVKGIPSISQVISTNRLIGSKEIQGELSTPWWADLIEEEGHFISPPRSKLSPQAPIFVPSSKTNPSMTVTSTSSNSGAIKISLVNRDMLHDLVSHDIETLNAIDNSKKSLTITTKDMGAFAKSPEPEAVISGLSPTTTYDIDLNDNIVRCSPIHEGVSRIKFEQASSTLYLPVITMNAGSKVIIRNLMVYEAAMSKSKLEFARYINLLSGIADATEDVRLLRQAGVIKGDLIDNEIATLFSTMQRSFVRSSGSSNVEIAMEKVNKYYDQRLIVRARRGLKKNTYVSWKFLPVALSISLSCCYFFRHFALCMAVTMSGAIHTRMMSINPRYCRNNLVLKFFNYLDLSYIS